LRPDFPDARLWGANAGLAEAKRRGAACFGHRPIHHIERPLAATDTGGEASFAGPAAGDQAGTSSLPSGKVRMAGMHDDQQKTNLVEQRKS